jgi:hypothetical protein
MSTNSDGGSQPLFNWHQLYISIKLVHHGQPNHRVSAINRMSSQLTNWSTAGQLIWSTDQLYVNSAGTSVNKRKSTFSGVKRIKWHQCANSTQP